MLLLLSLVFCHSIIIESCTGVNFIPFFVYMLFSVEFLLFSLIFPFDAFSIAFTVRLCAWYGHPHCSSATSFTERTLTIFLFYFWNSEHYTIVSALIIINHHACMHAENNWYMTNEKELSNRSIEMSWMNSLRPLPIDLINSLLSANHSAIAHNSK